MLINNLYQLQQNVSRFEAYIKERELSTQYLQQLKPHLTAYNVTDTGQQIASQQSIVKL